MALSGGYLTDAERLLRAILPRWTTGSIVDRTEHIQLDPFLTGYARFAKKIGEYFSVLVPDNSMTLSAAASSNNSIIEVNHIPHSLEAGQLLQINHNEIVRIISVDDITSKVYLEEKLLYDYGANSAVDIYGEFMQVYGTTPSGQPYMVVHSIHKIFRGDVVRVEDETREWWQEYDVAGTVYVGVDPIDGLHVFQLEFDRNLDMPISNGSWAVLRAFPAYESDKMALPTAAASETFPVGPIVLDYVSGRTISGESNVVEKANYEIMAADRDVIVPLTEFSKNTLVYRDMISADFIMFWDIGKGYVGYDGKDLICTLDENGEFYVSQNLYPNWDPGQILLWNVKVNVDDLDPIITPDGPTVRFINVGFRFPPNSRYYRRWLLKPGDVEVIQLELKAADEPAEQIEIYANGTPGLRFKISDIRNLGKIAGYAKWTLVARVAGRYNWGATGMLAKPFFKTIRTLKVESGEDIKLDGPKIMT